MAILFTYQDKYIYCHHTLDQVPNPDAFSMHAHELMEIFFFISGKGSYLVEGYEYPLHPNDILIMRMAETHKLVISPAEPYERISLLFSPSLLSPFDNAPHLMRPFLDRPLGRRNHYEASSDPQGRLRFAFTDFTFDNIQYPQINLLGRLLLFLTALGSIYDDFIADPVPVDGFQGQLVAYVNEHLFDNITLQSVADHFYHSTSQISRIFREATGSSLWKYVTIKRLMSAREAIQRGEPAGMACISCGFSDYSSFYRAYYNYFRHAPREDAPK